MLKLRDEPQTFVEAREQLGEALAELWHDAFIEPMERIFTPVLDRLVKHETMIAPDGVELVIVDAPPIESWEDWALPQVIWGHDYE